MITAAANISHSGLRENIEKILPPKFGARIDANTWSLPSVFGWLHAHVKGLTHQVVADRFNCGIGLVIIVPKGNSNWKHINGAVQIGSLNMMTNHSFKNSFNIFSGFFLF